jgi:type VI secretion system secreted protein Hcp
MGRAVVEIVMTIRTSIASTLACTVLTLSPLALADGSLVAVGQKTKFEKEKVTLVAYSAASPRDPASGLATGKMRHQPLCVFVASGPSTPLWFAALYNNENVSTLTAEFEGVRFKLTNANVTEVNLGQKKEGLKVCFTFQKIEITQIKSGNTTSSDWEAPAQ